MRVVKMPLSLTNEEMKEICLTVKALVENQLVYPTEEWELEHFDERLINRAKINQIVKKLRWSVSYVARRVLLLDDAKSET